MRFASLAMILCLVLPSGVSLAQARTVVAIAHRGEHNHHPENTIPAYQAAIKLGANFIEVDVRTTKDGKLVVMHDATVNKTTNGHGRVADMTLRQIRALDAGIKFSPRFAGTRVPTFDEVLRLARGKIGIYADVKQASAETFVNALKRYGMVPHTVVYPNYSVTFSQDVVRLDPAIKIMPESVCPEFARQLIDTFHPKIFAFSAFDFKPSVISVVKQAGDLIYVDRMGTTDNPAGWGAAIKAGADGIQTNYPGKLVQYLRSHGYYR